MAREAARQWVMWSIDLRTLRYAVVTIKLGSNFNWKEIPITATVGSLQLRRDWLTLLSLLCLSSTASKSAFLERHKLKYRNGNRQGLLPNETACIREWASEHDPTWASAGSYSDLLFSIARFVQWIDFNQSAYTETGRKVTWEKQDSPPWPSKWGMNHPGGLGMTAAHWAWNTFDRETEIKSKVSGICNLSLFVVGELRLRAICLGLFAKLLALAGFRRADICLDLALISSSIACDSRFRCRRQFSRAVMVVPSANCTSGAVSKALSASTMPVAFFLTLGSFLGASPADAISNRARNIDMSIWLTEKDCCFCYGRATCSPEFRLRSVGLCFAAVIWGFNEDFSSKLGNIQVSGTVRWGMSK